MPTTPAKRSSSHHSPHDTPQKQARLSSFFSSPKQQQTEHAFAKKEEDRPEHGSALTQEEQDEEYARQLQNEWDKQDAYPDTKEMERGVNTSEGSHSVKPEENGLPNTVKTRPSTSATTKFDWAALDATVAATDLQTDIFVFDPSNVDTTAWPTKRASDAGDGASVSDIRSVPSAPYALLSHACVLLSATRSRLAIVTILTNLLRTLIYHDADALLPCIYLVSNHIAPPYDGVELGLGGQICNKAIQNVTGKSNAQLRRWWNQTGDPGDVAFEAKKDVKTLVGAPKPIEITKLFATLHTIARISGTGSATAKMAHVTKLLAAARGEETRYLVRTFQSHLRINAVRTTITSAIARTFVLDGPPQRSLLNGEQIYLDDRERSTAQAWCISEQERHGILANASIVKQRNDPRRLRAMEKIARAERLLREVRARHPNFTSIVPALVEGGLGQLSQRVPLRIGTPLSPMLGSITRSLAAMFEKLGDRPFVSEFKYDGQRVQIHAQHVPSVDDNDDSSDMDRKRAELRQIGGKGKWVGKHKDVFVRLFSRHLEDMTDKYPDITALVPYLMGVDKDHEVIADVDAVKKEDEYSAAVLEEASRQDAKPVESFIMDAEVVAMSLDGTLQPFQTLTNRSRKDVELQSVKVAVGVFAFDLMQLNGRSLLKSSLRKRRSLMRQYLPPCRPLDVRIARFDYVKSSMSNSMEDVSAFFDLARQNRCEGIMVKSLDHHWEISADDTKDGVEGEGHKIELLSDEVDNEISQPDLNEVSVKGEESGKNDDPGEIPGKGVNGRGKALLSTYEPDKRCESWLKVKKDYIEGIGDSLDLVPIAGWHGMGRKAAWWSPVLLAVYDATTDEYHAVCKCISGFTDAEYKSIKFERFAEGSATCYDARTNAPRHTFDTGGLHPDVWFEPCEVWEIRGADITLSPVYPAAKGMISEERGLSLRFPRFLRRRTDKSPEQASTARQLANMYLEQNHTGAKEELLEEEADIEEFDETID